MAGGADNFRIGLVAELKAQAYYAELGYEIYTPIMAQSHADLIAVKGSETIKVQVKKATENPTKYGTYLQVRIQGRSSVWSGHSREYDENSFDELFIVHDLGYWRIPAKLILDKKSLTFGKIKNGEVVSGYKASLRVEDFKVH